MSFDIAKYPTLALVDSTRSYDCCRKRVYRNSATNCALFTRQREPFQRALRLRAGHGELTVALHYVYNTPFDQLIWVWDIRLIRIKF